MTSPPVFSAIVLNPSVLGRCIGCLTDGQTLTGQTLGIPKGYGVQGVFVRHSS